jgi:hypothetical protein
MRKTGLLLVTAASFSILLSFNSIPADGMTNRAESETKGLISIPQKTIPDSPWDGWSSNENASAGILHEAPEKPNFSGRWSLNRHASDDAGKMVKEALIRNRKLENPLGIRVRQVLIRRRNDPDQQLGRLLVQVLEAPESLLIQHEDTSLTIVDTRGRMRTLSFDGTPGVELGDGFAVTTRWSGMQLVSDVNLQNQGMARLTLALAPGGFQLHLTEQIQPFVLGKPIIVHNVYDFVAEN